MRCNYNTIPWRIAEKGEHVLEAKESLLYSLCFDKDKQGFPAGSDGKESAYNSGDPGSIPGLRRSPGEGNSYPLHYSCLENSMDKGAGGLQSMGL